jgi:hypothetical protein
MWSRINYLAGLIKPSRYVEGNTPFDNFVVPPLTTITIGDMYKDQPYVLQSVGISIPEDALWETVPESETEDWSYFNKKIIAKGGKDGEGGGKGKFAQFPREIEISVSGQLLEVERPRTGGVNFGDGEGNFSKGLIVT